MKGKYEGNFWDFFSLYTGVAPPTCSYYKLYGDGITEPGRMSILQ